MGTELGKIGSDGSIEPALEALLSAGRLLTLIGEVGGGLSPQRVRAPAPHPSAGQ